jgi:antitoxin ParD1/3/4
MATMNISLPDTLKSFVDAQVTDRGFGTSSEYVRELIRRERDRDQLRTMLMEGAQSGRGRKVDDGYLEELRALAAGDLPG